MKKFMAEILALLILCSCTASAAANGIDGQEAKSIEVSYTVAGNYEISIPSTGTSDADGKSGLQISKDVSLVPSEGAAIASFALKVNDVLLERGTVLRISVSSENRFSLLLPNGAFVPYILTGADEDGTVMLLHAGETMGEKALTITLEDTSGLAYAGTYYDKLTFECEILAEDSIPAKAGTE